MQKILFYDTDDILSSAIELHQDKGLFYFGSSQWLPSLTSDLIGQHVDYP